MNRTDNMGNVSIQVTEGGPNGIKIKNACIIHLARYPSRAQNGRQLVITMTRPFSKQRLEKGKKNVVFKCDINPSNERPTHAGSLSEWYEASVRSVVADEAFTENKTLEHGEIAQWTCEQLEEAGAFEDLCRPGLAMIPKMDNIGSSNDIGYSSGLTGRSKSGNTTYSECYGNGFW